MISIFSRANRQFLGAFAAHEAKISSMERIKFLNEIWTSSYTGEIAMWRMTCIEDLEKVGFNDSLHSSKILAMRCHVDDDQVFTLAFDGTFCGWNAKVKIINLFNFFNILLIIFSNYSEKYQLMKLVIL